MAVYKDVKFDFIRYASLWEDADVLCQALAPVGRRGRLLCIASGGDNALALLTLDPKQIVAVDLNKAQLACLELKILAFRHLSYDNILGFLGVTPRPDRLATYDGLKTELSSDSELFWENNRALLVGGIIHVGKFERYLSAFGKWILPFVHSTRTRKRLLDQPTLEAQQDFYNRNWNTWRYRLLFKLFFSRMVMGRAGRDPAFFTHVKGSVAQRIFDRTEYALTKISTRSNPYLRYIMTGNFSREALPCYLRPENFDVLSKRVDRIRTVLGTAQATHLGPYDGFGLSDIFEYMSPDEHYKTYQALFDQANPGARFVYWNMLAQRQRPESLTKRVVQLTDIALDLHRKDNAWFYQALHVDEVAT